VKKYSKIYIVFLITLIMLLFLGSIGNAGEKAVTLEYWMWDPDLRAKTENVIEAFEETHPGIKINLTTMEPKDYWVKMRIMASTGKLPDVFNMSSGYLEEWSGNGFLFDVTDYVNSQLTSEEYFLNLFKAGSKLANTDKVYAVPFALVVTVLYYNRDMFDEAGLDYPTSSWDWNDFLNAAKELTKDTDNDGKIDQWGYWFYGRYAHVESWIFRNGGRLIDRANMKFAPDANAVKAMQFLNKLILTYHVASMPKDMAGVRQQDVFPRGLAAMWIDGSWNIDNTRKIASSDMHWGISEVPLGPNGDPNSAYGWPDFIAMSSKTKHPNEAWEFVKFASGAGLSIDMYMAGKIPSYKPLALSDEFVDKTKQPAEMGLLLEIAGKTMNTSFTNGWSEWRGYGAAENMGLNGLLDAVFNGEMTLDEALGKAKTNANKVLDRLYK